MKLRTFKKYNDLKAAHQKDIHNFPIVYIFGKLSDEKLKERLKTIGEESLDNCVSIYGCGDIISKKNVDKFKELCALHEAELEAFKASEENLVDVILTAMDNHEYSYTQNPYYVLIDIGETMKSFENQKFARAWFKAEKICMNNSCWN